MTPPTRIRVGAHIYRVKRFFRVPGIGLFGESTSTLRAAARYIESR